jgi:hypothetical protein
MIKVEVIAPKELGFLSAENYIRAINRALDMRAEDIRIDFRVTVQTWAHKPKFVITAHVTEPIWRIIAPEDAGETPASQNPALIYKFVSGGTRVRYATMTPDFIAKTNPGVIGSGQGAGGVAFISKKHPKPGIQAREFNEVIAKKWESRFPSLMNQALRVEAIRLMRLAAVQ